MKEPKIFNRLGSAAQVTKSVIGTNGTIQGTPTFQAGKFGNGAFASNAANHITFTGTPFTPNIFTVEIWSKLNGYSVTNGVPSDAGTHAYWGWDISDEDRIICYYNIDRFTFGIKVSNTWYFFHSTAADFDISADTLHHIAFVYDRTGIEGGSNIRRIYLNGSLIDSSNDAVPNQSNSNGLISALAFNSLGSGIWTLNGLVDNFKFYDYAKTDFSDREDERGGLNDQNTIL